MIRSKALLLLTGLAGCVALVLVVRAAIGQEKTAPRPADPTKKVLEISTKNVVSGSAVVPPAPLVERKSEIESPTKTVVAGASGTSPPADGGFVNPKVQPGKVKWHATFETAREAAAKSGKPVLLFQMMGKLDDQFC